VRDHIDEFAVANIVDQSSDIYQTNAGNLNTRSTQQATKEENDAKVQPTNDQENKIKSPDPTHYSINQQCVICQQKAHAIAMTSMVDDMRYGIRYGNFIFEPMTTAERNSPDFLARSSNCPFEESGGFTRYTLKISHNVLLGL
jgi:hypothetical protein